MMYRILIFLASALGVIFISYQLSSKGDAEENFSSFETLMPETLTPPLGLPPIPWPADNPYSNKKAELGRLLYFDPRLSSDESISCASCHNIPCGYGDCKALAIGIKNTVGSRHSPTIINAAYSKHLFWDGRASSLEEQCKGPISNTKEMTTIGNVHEAHSQCAKRVKEIPGYQVLFKQVFGEGEITIDEIAKAIATFERTILSGNSPYDRYHAGDLTALGESEIRGEKIFKKSGCANCHAGPNFTDERFLNIGIGMDKENPDLGRYAITHQEKDWGAFKVPTLRETAHSGPYMHDGSIATLQGVIEYYDTGGIKNKNLHPLMKPLHLSAQDKTDLLNFLKALSGEGWYTFQQPSNFP